MNPQNVKVLGLVALADLLVGMVLAAFGVVNDTLVLSVAGTVLLISGAGMLTWLMLARDKPTTL